MTAICEAAIHLCAVRVTRLDAVGNPVAGPNNVYVSDNSIMLSVTPEIEAGEDKTLVGGCDCIIASYKGYDKLKRFTLELDQGKIEPGLLEMLTGGSIIVDPANANDPQGMWFASQLSCQDAVQPNVCFEGWQDLWEDDHQASTPYQYVHWIWPSSHWQLGDFSLQNDFTQPKLTGFTRGNPNWGLGIFGDLPEAAEALGGFFFDDSRPDATCDYQSWAIT
jgi:hypothetical protein